MRRVLDRRFAHMAREVAATAEAIALTYEHLADDPPAVEPRRTRLRCSAQDEHTQARRLWELAQLLDPDEVVTQPAATTT